MRRPRREPWSFWSVLKCSVNWPMRSLSRAIWTSGLPVSLACVPYWSMRDFFCSLANTTFLHSCLLIDCLVTFTEYHAGLRTVKQGCRRAVGILPWGQATSGSGNAMNIQIRDSTLRARLQNSLRADSGSNEELLVRLLET